MKRKLDKIFYPKTIAVIGASNTKTTVGYALMRNLLQASFSGKVYPVNIKYQKVFDLQCYARVKDIPDNIDLAVIATPAHTVPKLVKECGTAEIESLVIIAAGFRKEGKVGQEMYKEITTLARKYKMRIIGPNSLGIMNVGFGLNASFARRMALRGGIAFISQSGALCASVLDWSVQQNVGFSHVVSIGATLDVDYHDLIDYFGSDPKTNCILIYMESLTNARAFISAARAFARSKPIIVLKAGRSEPGAIAAMSHTGVLAGNDVAFEAAFRRAGIIRVETLAQLFHCAQTVAMQPRPLGNRLAIITNAGGPGILATDYLIRHGGRIAKFPKNSLSILNQVLPLSWKYKDPKDVLDDATAENYGAALEAVLEEDIADAVLAILIPQSPKYALQVAKELTAVAKSHKKMILACWMGEEDVNEARDWLEQHQIPNFRYPERAVDIFLKMYGYTKNMELLYETPSSIPRLFKPDTDSAKALLQLVKQDGRRRLTDREVKALLAHYDIEVIPGLLVHTAKAAIAAATKIGFPVVLKIAAPEVAHKTAIGGVQLNLDSAEAVKAAYELIMVRAEKQAKEIEILGVLVEPMIYKKHELLIGAHKDEVFGPVILFGMGGVAVEVFKDVNAGLPPLNMALAKRIIEGTKVYELLKGYRGLKGVNLQDLQFLLYKFSYLLMDFPEIKSIDINPYMVDETGGIVLDAKVELDRKSMNSSTQKYEHLVISPYPQQYIKTIRSKTGERIVLRPIRPEDEPLEAEMFEYLSKETIYFRFFGYVPQVTHKFLSRFTQIDYDREMAIVAEVTKDRKKRLAGVVRLVSEPFNESAEYAIVIADPWQGQGLGKIMTEYILDIAREKGIKKITASVMTSNEVMIHILRKLGFTLSLDSYDSYVGELKL